MTKKGLTMKKLNVYGMFSRGYFISQTGETSFDLRNKDNGIIVEFEVDSIEDSIEFMHTRLLVELDYHIREIEEDNEDYFFECDEQEKEHIKTKFLKEVKLIGDILR